MKHLRGSGIKEYLPAGIAGAAAFSMQYTVPVLDTFETSEFGFSNEIRVLAKGLNGHGLLWSVLALSLAYFMNKTRNMLRENNISFMPGLALISAAFGLLNTAGLFMFHMDSLPFGYGAAVFLMGLIAAAGWAVMFYTAAVWLIVLFGKRTCNEAWEIDDRKLLFGSAAAVLAGWLPWMLVYYPASMDNDVFFQLTTALGYIPKTNHHPWFSSVVLASFYRVGRALGSENAGIFLYVLVRNVLIAVIYARGIVLLKRSGAPKNIVIGTVLFYAVTPVWGAYSKHAFKDTFGAGLFCWFVLALITSLKKEKQGKDPGLAWAEAGLAGALASLFRNNFIYAIFPAVVLTAGYLVFRKSLKKAILLIGCLSIFFLYNQYIFRIEGVMKGSVVEAAAIPMQQTARVVSKERNTLTAEEAERITQFWDLDELGEKYNPIHFDPVKFAIRMKENATGKDYVKLWIFMFPRHKRAYIEAFIAQNYAYYSFTPRRAYWEGGYNSNMVIYDWINTNNKAWLEHYHFSYINAFGLPRKLLHNLAELWDRTPVLNLTDTAALYTWMIVLIGYWLLRKKAYVYLLPVFAVLLLICSCMAAPVNDCFRYFAPVAAAFPVLLSLVFCHE